MFNIIPFKDRKINFAEKIKIYRNLNRKGKIYSITQNNLVCGYTDNITVSFCNLKINKAGKQKTIESGIRNVHAFIEGYIVCDVEEYIRDLYKCPIKYNPFVSNGFILSFGDILSFEIKECTVIKIINGDVYGFVSKDDMLKYKLANL